MFNRINKFFDEIKKLIILISSLLKDSYIAQFLIYNYLIVN